MNNNMILLLSVVSLFWFSTESTVLAREKSSESSEKTDSSKKDDAKAKNKEEDKKEEEKKDARKKADLKVSAKSDSKDDAKSESKAKATSDEKSSDVKKGNSKGGDSKTENAAESDKPVKPKKKKKKVEAKEEPQAAVEKPAAEVSTTKAVTPEAAKTETKNATSERSTAPNSTGKENKANLILKTDVGCFVTTFESNPGEVISCTKPLPMDYTKRDCATSETLEIGHVDAFVSCTNQKDIDLRFRTSKEAITASLRVQRTTDGRSGFVTEYLVLTARKEESSFTRMMPEPELKPLVAEKVEEAPVTMKLSGFAWVESEMTKNWGYNVGNTSVTPNVAAIPNFTSSAQGSEQQNTNFFSNLTFEIGKDKTNLTTVLEIGEVYFGDSSSGGAQGARSTSAIELRNIFVSHDFSEKLNFKGGIITTASDPRGFVFNDHISALQLNYKTDLSEGMLWYGNSSQKRPDLADPDSRLTGSKYYGFSGTLGFLSAVKASVYGVYQNLPGETLAVSDGAGGYTAQTGNSAYSWLGLTVDYQVAQPLSAQFSFVANQGKTKLNSTGESDSMNSSLADLRLSWNLASSQVNMSLEGLVTQGEKDTRASVGGSSLQVFGKRKAFMSVIGASYLMSIATSDGVDDAPGTPKQSVIGSLSQDEGLKVGVFSVSYNPNKKTTLLVRAGVLETVAENATTNSNKIGSEVDFSAVYQVAPTLGLQFDLAQFNPGAYYAQKDAAFLGAAKLKFGF